MSQDAMTQELMAAGAAPRAEIILAGEPAELIEQAARAARALKQVVDQAHLALNVGGHEHLQFEAWQTVGHFYGVTALIPQGAVTALEADGQVHGYQAYAIAVRNGEKIGGAEAMCTRDEKSWRDRPDFQLASMAQTRAMSKALRSVLAFVVVLAGYSPTPAEEMISSERRPLRPVTPPREAAVSPEEEEDEALAADAAGGGGAAGTQTAVRAIRRPGAQARLWCEECRAERAYVVYTRDGEFWLSHGLPNRGGFHSYPKELVTWV